MRNGENGSPWPPVNMVLRAPAAGQEAASSPSEAPDAAPAAAGARSEVDPAVVAERVFRLMQRDLRLERERVRRAGGR